MKIPISDVAYGYLLSVYDTEEAQMKRIKAGRANDVDLSQLTMVFETISLINMINGCTATE